MTTQEILQMCSVDGLIVRLPATNLERKQYLEVKKALELIGGKWKAGKTQGFVFDQDPTGLLQAQANGENRNLKKEYQFFATPKDLAKEMADKLAFAFVASDRILEPSAGDGALIKAIWEKHGKREIDCFEIMELNRMRLEKLDSVNIIGEDFLQCDDHIDYYDYIIANPPFTKNQDIIHIAKMYQCLKPGGSIVALASPSWTFGSQKIQIDFRNWLLELKASTMEVDEGTFKDSGTTIRTIMITIEKPADKVIDIPDSIENKLNALRNLAANTKALSEEESESGREVIQKAIDAGQELVQMLEVDNESENDVRKCRVCGCTDHDCRQCIKKTGQPCHWVEYDLCSACYLPPTEEILDSLIENEKSIQNNLKELKNLLSTSKNNDMNFFEQLVSAGNVDMSIRIMQKGDRLTLNVMPGSGQSVTKPIIITGTPQELDEKFFENIYPEIREVTGIIHSLDQVKKEAMTKKEEKSSPSKDNKSKPREKVKSTKKPVVKKPEVEKADLFAAASENNEIVDDDREDEVDPADND